MSADRKLHAASKGGGPLCRQGSIRPAWVRGHFAVVTNNARVTCASCRARLLERPL